MKIWTLAAAFAAGALLLCGPAAQAADNYTVKDSTGATKTICAEDAAGVYATCHVSVNADGSTKVDPATSTLQTSANTKLDTLATDTGSPGETACATDTASCSNNQQNQRIAQRLTTLNTTLGTPDQAGTASNASSGVATSSTNKGTIAYNYCWNGATWDQCNPASGTAVTGTVSLTANQGVTETPNITASYSYGFSGLVLAASGTDFLTITNTTNTKVTRVSRVTMVCSAASAVQVAVTMLRRSTADTGGTSSTLTAVPVDTGFSAAQSVVKTYTANPTTGTLVGNTRQEVILANVTTAAPDRLAISFGANSASQPSIRASTEVIALNAGGVTTGATCSGTVEVTEQ